MKTKSIWGNPPKRLYNLIKRAEIDYGKNFETCIVGCSDGKFLMPFARKGYPVTGYDIDEIALYGGVKTFPIIKNKVVYEYTSDFISEKYELEDKVIMGLSDRIEKENLNKYANIELRDFYKDVPNEKFDVVFTSCSLHYSVNQNFSLKEKILKLQEVVRKNGLLYIDYMMAIDEQDDKKYPFEKFFRKGEILKYFDKNWKIIFHIENNYASFEGAHVDCVKDHFHRFGYILARKLD